MTKDQDYIRRLEAKIVDLTMRNDDLWKELEDAKAATNVDLTKVNQVLHDRAKGEAVVFDPVVAAMTASVLNVPVTFEWGYHSIDGNRGYRLTWGKEGGE
jgi:predicted transcriptional regulator